MRDTLWFTKSNGLNNAVDSVRLPYSPDTGITDLAKAINVDFDITGRPSRRKGFSSTIINFGCHSLYSHGDTVLFVKADSNQLCQLHIGFEHTVLRSISGIVKVRYTAVGGRIFFVNGVDKGYVEEDSAYDWVMPTLQYKLDNTKAYSDPPNGTNIAYFNGRMYIVSETVCWYSEPFSLNHFNLSSNYLPFESRIRMWLPVKTGIYVSTEEETIFLSGTNPKEFEFTQVANYPAIEGTDTVINGSSLLTDNKFVGKIGIWTSTKGICIGLPDGTMINLTESKLNFPTPDCGSHGVIKDNYISLLEI